MDTGLDYVGPDEAGVFLVQLCYDILTVCSDKYEKFDYLLYLVDRSQSKHDTILQLKLRFEQFLETCPLIDVVMPLLINDSAIKTVLTILSMMSSEYTIINTAIFISTKCTSPEF